MMMNGEDIDSLMSCITDYITFCVENIVPVRTVQCYPNKNPWVTPQMKAVLKKNWS